MGLFDFLNKKMSEPITPVKVTIGDDTVSLYANELAFSMCVNLISNAVTKCEVLTYRNGKREKSDEWYRWNVSPNPNQNSSQFFSKLIYRLYNDGHALVVPINNNLYVADGFTVNDSMGLLPHTFEHIQIGSFAYGPRLSASDVYYFELPNDELKGLLDNTMNLYASLLSAAYSNYMAANGTKGFLHIHSVAENSPKFKDTIQNLFNVQFKHFFNSNKAVMPLYDGYEWEDYKGGPSSANGVNDTKGLVQSTLETYAQAMGIPKSLITGEVQDTSKAIDQLLTLCIDPLLENIADEINRKNYSKQDLLNGTRVRFNTNAMKHIDLIDVAQSIDKLISSGFACINDLRELCHMDLIDEPWANEFFMTKNYSKIEDIVNQLETGRKEE